MIRIALAGNPNCGKTTIFNALTGLNYKVANYPGVTVERKEGKLHLQDIQEEVTLVDLPGIYSLSSTSLDEKIATDSLFGEMPGSPPLDAVIVVVDASNLERNLYLTTQLIDCRIPLMICLNMGDLAEKNGFTIREELLSRELDVPLVSCVASKSKGIEDIRSALSKLIKNPKLSSKNFAWSYSVPLFLDKARILGKMLVPDEGRAFRIAELKGCGLISESLTNINPLMTEPLQAVRKELLALNIDPFSFEATARYHWIRDILSKVCKQAFQPSTFTRKIDSLLTHKIWGSIIFLTVMAVIFQSIFTWSKLPMEFIDSIVSGFGVFVGSHLPDGQLKSLIVDGIIAGVGSVLVFIPQIAVLFIFLGLLEDSGYLSRAAFLMDGIMRTVGLQGRSFIPLLSSFACAIPGILSTRTIPSWADRLTTILVAPLMSCSARLPVYTVLIAAFIPSKLIWGVFSLQGITLLAMYLLGIIGAAGVSWVLKKTILKREPAFFVMELPPFRQPSLKHVFREVYDRIKIFCQSAGTVILACSILLWFLASYPRLDEGKAPALNESYAGKFGAIIEPVIKPIGYNWEIGIGLIASFAAREVFVSSLATIYNVGDGESKDSSTSLISKLKEKNSLGQFSLASALSLMVFYVFACQCMSTIAVCRRETGSWKWVIFMFGYMGVLAYSGAFITYITALHFGLG